MKSLIFLGRCFLGCMLLLSAASISMAFNGDMFHRHDQEGGARRLLGSVSAASGGMLSANNEFNRLFGNRQQSPHNRPESEVYGIVEPLIEDTPCADRPCSTHDDCCLNGVCVNNHFGKNKCAYVYGRQRPCRWDLDCVEYEICAKDVTGTFVCQEPRSAETKQFGDECSSSSDCDVAGGMCCQVQHGHAIAMPRKICAYFRDPFVCSDISPTKDDEDSRARGGKTRHQPIFRQMRV